MAKSQKLGDFIEKCQIAKIDWKGSQKLEVLGVSNVDGITKTAHKKSKDLGKYLVIEPNYFAYNPYRINVGSIGLTPTETFGLVSPAYVVFKVKKDKLIPELLLDYLKSFHGLQQINKYARGTVRKALRYDDLCKIDVNFPEFEKQKSIFKKKLIIEKENNNLIKEINSQKNLLTQLKQSILQEAIQGKLTKEWREQNPTTEPASELLKRIKAEKAQLIKEKKIKKEKPLPTITKEEIPFELPEGWVWTKLNDICSKTGSGSTPRGGQSAYTELGIPFIRSQNVYDEGLRMNVIAFISETVHEKMKGTKVQSEDLLLNITGGSIGRCCIVPKEFKTGNINQHVAIIRTVNTFNGYFIHKVICSPYFQNMIIEVQTGAGREGLPKNKMDNILIAFPPLEEQKEIVKKVEILMQQCQELEQEIQTSEVNAQMLMQAVLKEAFESKENKPIKM
jgi:type I restriction enzyme S subunit